MTQAQGRTSYQAPRAESTLDVLDVLASGVAKAAVRENSREPAPRLAEPAPESRRELLTEKMLADRWACSVARLQRWRTVGGDHPI